MHVDFHLDKDFNTSNTKCKHTRTVISFGGPLAGYKNTGDERAEQSDSKFKVGANKGGGCDRACA